MGGGGDGLGAMFAHVCNTSFTCYRSNAHRLGYIVLSTIHNMMGMSI